MPPGVVRRCGEEIEYSTVVSSVVSLEVPHLSSSKVLPLGSHFDKPSRLFDVATPQLVA